MRPLPAILAFALVVLTAGCTSYSPPEERVALRIHLLPVIVEPGVPQIAAPLSRNVREKLVHARYWKLADDPRAEAALQIRVLGTTRKAMARDPEDTGRPISILNTIQVEMEWLSDLPPPWGPDSRTRIESDSLIYAQPSLVGAETAAVADLAEDLAEKIVERLNWPLRESQE